MIRYKPTDSKQSPKFCGIRTFMRLPHLQTLTDIDFAVVGIPFDTGATVKVGARFGPEAIRSNSINLKPYNLFQDISIFDYCSGVDFGDVSIVPGYIEDSMERIEKTLSPLIDHDIVPIALGGDHSITLPELRAVAQKHGPVSLVHFDAHSDTGDLYFGRPFTHGTPFRRAAEEKLIDPNSSIQIGLRGQLYHRDGLREAHRLGFETLTAVEAQDIGLAEVLRRIRTRTETTKVFVTFDIDCVDPAFAPGTGTPEVGGFTSAEAIGLIRGLAGLDIVGFDIVEVLPAYDPAQITALLAANIAYECVSLIALKKKSALQPASSTPKTSLFAF